MIERSKVIDLTGRWSRTAASAGRSPQGDWTIMRFVARSTGQTTRPAPQTGHGFETNKFDGDSYRRHWNDFQAKLLEKIVAKGGPLQPGKGLTTIHLDSWEMSSQNWTADFREEFQNRRGYDPQPFYPAWMGLVVGSLEKTERFLWDMRKTSQELVLEEHAGEIKQIAHEHGLLYSNEPYDMNPAGDIDLGSVADMPMCEFWNAPHDTQYSCIEAVSIAHTMGPQVVKAEAFTSSKDAFAKHPGQHEEPDRLGIRDRHQRYRLSHLPAPGTRRERATGDDHGTLRHSVASQPNVLAISAGVSCISGTLFASSAPRRSGGRHPLPHAGRRPTHFRSPRGRHRGQRDDAGQEGLRLRCGHAADPRHAGTGRRRENRLPGRQ